MSTKLDAVISRVCRSHCWTVTSDGVKHLQEPLDDYKVDAHLRGDKRYGACPINPDTSTTRLALLDLDSHKGETPWDEMVTLAREIKATAALVGLRATAVKSSGGQGIHLFFVWKESQDAYSVRMALLTVLQNLGYANGAGGVAKKQIEIFPKQNSVPADGCGNMFVLPYAGKSELLSTVDSWAESDDVTVLTKPERKNGSAATSVVRVRPELHMQSVPEGRGTPSGEPAAGSGLRVAGQTSGHSEDRHDGTAVGVRVDDGGGSDSSADGSTASTGHAAGAVRGHVAGRDTEAVRAGSDRAEGSAGSSDSGTAGVRGAAQADRGGSTEQVVHTDADRNVEHTLGLLISACEAIPDGDPAIEDRDTWLRAIFGIHAGTAGSDAGRDLAHRFSARSRLGKYDAAVLDDIWDNAGERGDQSVTERTVYHLARKHGWRGDDLADFDALGPATETVRVGADSAGGNTLRHRFAFQSVRQFDLRPALRWIIKTIFPDAGLGFIFGESSSGKSFFALDMACAIARGTEWRGNVVKQRRVGYLAAEGARGFARRLRAFRKHNGLSSEDLSGLLILDETPDLMNIDDALELGRRIVEAGVKVLFVDTLAQVSAGHDENSGADMGTLMLHCKKIYEHTGCSVVLIHHTGKDASRGARGHSSFRGNADFMIEINRDGNSRSAYVYKMKDGEEHMEFPFRLSEVLLSMDEDGELETSCVVEHLTGAHTPVRAKATRKGAVPVNEQKVKQVLSDHGTGGPMAYNLLVEETITSLLPTPDAPRGPYKQRVEKAIANLAVKGEVVNNAGMYNLQDFAG